jgi:hypothetical protein
VALVVRAVGLVGSPHTRRITGGCGIGYDVGVSADPEVRQGRSVATVVPALVIAGLAAATIVAAFLPWGTGRVLFISQTVDGFDLDGGATLAIGVAIIIGVAAYLVLRFDGILLSLYTLAGGLSILGVAIWQWTKLEDVIFRLGPFTVRITPEVTIEEGMIMTLLSGAGIIIVSLWQLVVAYRDRPAS